MKNLSDERLDQILSGIVKASALSKESMDDIANSPKLLWDVRRSIEVQKSVPKRSWFLVWRIPAFASLALLVCAGLFWSIGFRNVEVAVQTNSIEATIPEIRNASEMAVEPQAEIVQNAEFSDPERPEIVETKRNVQRKAEEHDLKKSVANVKSSGSELAKIQPVAEKLKTDFIALSYSTAADSGQVLNVQVPRSMMVSLGVSSNVENISELVNAEVIVGDDGLARAIRFVK